MGIDPLERGAKVDELREGAGALLWVHGVHALRALGKAVHGVGALS